MVPGESEKRRNGSPMTKRDENRSAMTSLSASRRVSDFINTVLAIPDFWVFNKRVRRMNHSNSVPELEEAAVDSKKVKNGKKKILLKIEVLVFKIGEKMILV